MEPQNPSKSRRVDIQIIQGQKKIPKIHPKTLELEDPGAPRVSLEYPCDSHVLASHDACMGCLGFPGNFVLDPSSAEWLHDSRCLGLASWGKNTTTQMVVECLPGLPPKKFEDPKEISHKKTGLREMIFV